jgi:hypothetical protein
MWEVGAILRSEARTHVFVWVVPTDGAEMAGSGLLQASEVPTPSNNTHISMRHYMQTYRKLYMSI